MLTSTLFAGSLHKGNVATSSFTLVDNHQYGDNYQGTFDIFPKDYVAKKGDKIKITLEGTIDKDVVYNKEQDKSLTILFVDGSSAANWWLPLTGDYTYKEDLKAGGKIVIDYTFEVTTNGVSKAGSKGCMFVLGTSKDQKTPVVLKTTKFSYEIIR